MILMYHRVESLAWDPHDLAVRSGRFGAQIAALTRCFTPVSLDEIADAVRSHEPIEDRVALTFDDGYVDNLMTASPILIEARVPATFFLTTDGLDVRREYWWDTVTRIFSAGGPIPPRLDLGDNGAGVWPTVTREDRIAAHTAVHARLRALPREARQALLARVVNWSGLSLEPQTNDSRVSADEVRELAARPGHTIGAHTATHPWLPEQPADVQRREIGESRAALERLTGRPVRAFAYPYGAFDGRTPEYVAEAGLTCAVTTVAARVGRGTDPLCLPRVHVHDEDADAFLARLGAVPSEPAP